MNTDPASDSRPRADPDWQPRVRIVLVRPEHAGNVGAAARAMKNMGFSDLRLVAPACGHLTADALTMAYGARDVLERARVHATLADATAEARWVAGFAMPRIGRPVDGWLPDAGSRLGLRARTDDIALLFGSEISGLSNDDLAACHEIVAIATHAAQPSLNLSQAVLLACYELVRGPAPAGAPPRALATANELDGLHTHLADELGTIGFLHPPHDRHLLRDLRTMIHRAELDPREVRILRGILSQARWARERAHGAPPPSRTTGSAACGSHLDFGSMATVIDDLLSPAAPPAPRAPDDPSGIRTTTSTTFHSLPIAPQVLEGLDRLGYTHCTPIQEQTLPLSLAGKDVAGQAQTGTGKTAAFLVSLFTRLLNHPPAPKTPRASPRALVIAPTRELVVQIEQEARDIGVTTGVTMMAVYGGIDYIKQRDLLAAGVDVLVGTPGRLIDYFKQKIYDLRRTEVLVVDEADRMFDMGFIADIRYLLRRLPPYDKRQSMLFSATLSMRVMELCYEHMNNPVKVSVTPRQITAEKVQEVLFHVEKAKKTSLLLGLLKRESWERVLIFVNTKHVGERLTDVLNHQGYTARALTGDIPQNKRLKYLERFKSGELKILVATDVASRGLHIEGVSIVVNFDLPQDREDYVHRIGRTARAGATGKAISLACEEYVMTLEDIEAFTGHKVPVEWAEDELFLPVAHTPRRPRQPLPGSRPSSGAPAHGARASDPGRRGPSRSPGSRPAPAGKGSPGSRRPS